MATKQKKLSALSLKKYNFQRRLTSMVLLAFLLFFNISEAIAATIVVDKLTDIGNSCELRGAIHSTNTGSDQDGCFGTLTPYGVNDTINFDPSLSGGTVHLNYVQLPTIIKPVTIDGDINGNGFGEISIDGQNASGILEINTPAAAPTTLNGLSFLRGSNAGGGGAVHVQTDSDVDITNSTFTNNKTTSSGGAIKTEGDSVVNITNTTLNLNQATNDGGAIDITETDLTLNNVTLANNTATYGKGGAVRHTSSAPRQIVYNGGSATGNRANTDGGVFAGEDISDVDVDGVSFTNNTATNGEGGAIFSASPFVGVHNSIFSGNISSGNGGAISLNRNGAGRQSDLISTNTSYSSNQSQLGNGGAVWCNQLLGVICNLDISGDIADRTLFGFSNNTANMSGGAVATSDTATGTPNLFNISNTFFNTNISQGSGGAITGNVNYANISNTNFTHNESGTGGAVRLGDSDENDTDIDFQFDGNQFNNNRATTGNGGAISLISNSTTPVFFLGGNNNVSGMINNTDFANNSADASGGKAGALYMGYMPMGAYPMNMFINDTAGSSSDFNGNIDAYGSPAINNDTDGSLIGNNINFFNHSSTSTTDSAVVASSGQIDFFNVSIFNNLVGALHMRSLGFGAAPHRLANSTVSGNTYDGFALIQADNNANFQNNTIVFNQELPGGLSGFGALRIGAYSNLSNNILSQNTVGPESSGPNCSPAFGYSVISGKARNFISDDTDCTPITGSPLGTDVIGGTVPLSPLALHGGYTFTHNINGNSAALDGGNESGDAFDQNLVSRPQGAATDIGSTDVSDTFGPGLTEVIPVPTPGTNTAPSYTFVADEAGTMVVGGGCMSASNTIIQGSNVISFSTLTPGTYSTCTITAQDALGNTSTLNITPFTITTTTPVTPPTGGGGGAGNVGGIGQPACSGDECNGNNNNPTTPATPENPPVNLPTEPVTPTTPTEPSTPAIPVTPNNPSPVTPQPSNPNTAPVRPTTRPAAPVIPAIGGPGPDEVTIPVVEVTEPIIEPVETPVSTPVSNFVANTPRGNLYDVSLVITTPEKNQISADDTPFVTGQGLSAQPVYIYIFSSDDFNPIRDQISQFIEEENQKDPSRANLSAEQLQQEFDERFTNAVIGILQKNIDNTLDPNDPIESKFINRISKLGETESGNNKLFLLDSEKSIRDSQYLLMATSDNGSQKLFSKEVPFTIDSTLQILTPEVNSLGNKTISADDLLGGLHIDVDPGNFMPALVGKIKQPSKIVANWQSELQTSALIADSLDEEFRLLPATALPAGDHTVYVTAYRRSDNAQSQTLKINFRIPEGVPFNPANYWWLIALAIVIIGGVIFLIARRNSHLPPAAAVVAPTPSPAPKPTTTPSSSAIFSAHSVSKASTTMSTPVVTASASPAASTPVIPVTPTEKAPSTTVDSTPKSSDGSQL